MKWPILSLLVLCMIVGCESNNEAARTAKREQDRQALMLADAQRERDNFKGQVEALRSSLDKATQGQQQAQTELASSNSMLTRAQGDIATLKSSQADAEQIRQQLTQAQAQIREMKVQIDALKEQLQKASAPAMNK